MKVSSQGIVPIDVYLTARGKPELKHLFTHSTDTQGGHRVEASRPLALRSGRHNRITVRNRTTGVPETLQHVTPVELVITVIAMLCSRLSAYSFSPLLGAQFWSTINGAKRAPPRGKWPALD